jgi:hypothetical protein
MKAQTTKFTHILFLINKIKVKKIFQFSLYFFFDIYYIWLEFFFLFKKKKENKKGKIKGYKI